MDLEQINSLIKELQTLSNTVNSKDKEDKKDDKVEDKVENKEKEDKVEDKQDQAEDNKEKKEDKVEDKQEDFDISKIDSEKLNNIIQQSNKVGKDNKVLRVAIGLGIDEETAAKRVDMFNEKLTVEEIIEAVKELSPSKENSNQLPASASTGFGTNVETKEIDLSNVSLSDIFR